MSDVATSRSAALLLEYGPRGTPYQVLWIKLVSTSFPTPVILMPHTSNLQLLISFWKSFRLNLRPEGQNQSCGPCMTSTHENRVEDILDEADNRTKCPWTNSQKVYLKTGESG